MAKTPIIISALFFLFCLSVGAQQTKLEDYLVLINNDTIYGSVSYINEKALNRGFRKKVRSTDSRGRTKKYRRESTKAFRVNGVDYHSFWLSQPKQPFPPTSLVNLRYDIDLQDGKHYFLKVMSVGSLNHYKLEWFDQGDSQLWSMSLLKKVNDDYFIRADQGLMGLKRKVLQQYFADCNTLEEKIENSEISKVWQVVETYNRHCER
ncbi:MAG: hypothetical protein AAF616_04790 [Bacteroidota bacterium]